MNPVLHLTFGGTSGVLSPEGHIHVTASLGNEKVLEVTAPADLAYCVALAVLKKLLPQVTAPSK